MSPSTYLEDHTNESRAFRLPSPVLDNKVLPSLNQTSSHRVLRFHHLDSSENFPSEHTSIYDAEPVICEKDESLEMAECDDREDPRVPPSHILQSSSSDNLATLPSQHPSPAEFSSQALNVNSTSKSRWPTTRLDTIAERLSHKAPRTSVSVSGAVSASAEILETHPAAATATTSWKLEGSNCKARAQRLFDICHRRSFSLNDLDCLKPCKFQPFLFHDSGSSSGDTLRTACLCEVYPIQPMEPPPVRVPTPPGLPTFGTKEAMEYRMPAPDRTPWLPPWRTARHLTDRPGSSTNTPDAANGYGATGSNPSPLTDGLRRLLGITRIVSPIPEEPRRAALPLYLARADDSTFVRGRFGVRHSAHGIGRGHLDNHPFHRVAADTAATHRTSIDRAIEEIDKACAEAQSQRMASASPRINDESAPRSRSGSPRLPAERALNIAEILSQPAPSNIPVSIGPAPRLIDHMRSPPSLTFEPVGSGGSIRSQSTAGIDGIRHFVEQGERVSLGQNRELTEKKKQRGKCANCWFAFCVCCCNMDDPDRDIVDAARVMSPERGVSTVQSPEIRPLRIVHEQPRVQRMLYR